MNLAPYNDVTKIESPITFSIISLLKILVVAGIRCIVSNYELSNFMANLIIRRSNGQFSKKHEKKA